jgi:hypothetical protein
VTSDKAVPSSSTVRAGDVASAQASLNNGDAVVASASAFTDPHSSVAPPDDNGDVHLPVPDDE